VEGLELSPDSFLLQPRQALKVKVKAKVGVWAFLRSLPRRLLVALRRCVDAEPR
jgi:hypothetical protein